MLLPLLAWLAYSGSEAVAQQLGQCGSREPPPELFQSLSSSQSQRLEAAALVDDFVINTYVHVITTAAAEGQYSRALIDAQMATLNERYVGSGFSFTTTSVDYTVNDTWARCYDPLDTGCSPEYTAALRQGGYGDLNIYYLSDLGDGVGVLGFAQFPKTEPTDKDRTIDGVNNLAATLTGAGVSGYEDYDLGLTTVHEVAHWLGLFHTFQGFSCSGSGDFVDDTPQQLDLNGGCPVRVDSCPDQPGDDPVNNYMDYTVDTCKTEFTNGQIERMQNLYSTLRLGR